MAPIEIELTSCPILSGTRTPSRSTASARYSPASAPWCPIRGQCRHPSPAMSTVAGVADPPGAPDLQFWRAVNQSHYWRVENRTDPSERARGVRGGRVGQSDELNKD
jgi:hypothetical protein